MTKDVWIAEFDEQVDRLVEELTKVIQDQGLALPTEQERRLYDWAVELIYQTRVNN